MRIKYLSFLSRNKKIEVGCLIDLIESKSIEQVVSTNDGKLVVCILACLFLGSKNAF